MRTRGVEAMAGILASLESFTMPSHTLLLPPTHAVRDSAVCARKSKKQLLV
jgi:hypothetical protein